MVRCIHVFFQAEGYDKLKRINNYYYASCFFKHVNRYSVCACMSLYSLYSSSFTWINQDKFSRHENVPQCYKTHSATRRRVQVFSASGWPFRTGNRSRR